MVHKMGSNAFQDIIDDRLPARAESTQICRNHSLGLPFESNFRHPIQEDYRHVVVTRDFYEAVRSGYLYHKSGRECWLDWFGQNAGSYSGWLLAPDEEYFKWENRLENKGFRWIPASGRNLCQYLADESEEDGLLVYMAWALDIYLQPLIEFTLERRQKEQSLDTPKTMYVCFDSLYAENKENMIREISAWLFPGLTRDLKPVKTDNTNAEEEERKMSHSTTTDPNVRTRLRNIIAKLDHQIFNHSFSHGTELFECKGYRRRLTYCSEATKIQLVAPSIETNISERRRNSRYRDQAK
jgi:hypothetical protein